ncbi:MAG: twin-arginine translocase TatA/TatE family subunit [Euryarchaeota archaeon]|nr:twin-arginine translocase TatA/TatE family subunit [Euryarchaeota archaeon]|tara:strand:- start:1268 stop:1561 length:294 start_codon:yes stop_codon:yes gene_type:complete
MAIGPPEIAVILIIFFLLFGAERLPKLARSMGQAKGEFQEGLSEVTNIPEKKKTFTDLDAGGRTPEQKLADDAKNAGIDPTGMDTDSIKDELEEKED